jgi:hypothetical protein
MLKPKTDYSLNSVGDTLGKLPFAKPLKDFKDLFPELHL